MAKVMVVEDDADLRGVLLRGLPEEGFETTGAAPAASCSSARAEAPDVLIVDIGLPDTDGRDVCQALRARGIETPVLFLTARDALTDRLTGFSAGGDDYLTKPFAFAEVVARLQALLRRRRRRPRRRRRAQTRPVAHAAFADDAEDRAHADRVPAARELVASPGRPSAGASSSRPAGRTARTSATTRSTPTSRGSGASSPV